MPRLTITTDEASLHRLRVDAAMRNTTWFVTRHPGAIEWAARQGLPVDRHVAHLDPESVAAGDTVIGILPVNLAARVCARGARYFNLSLDLPAEARGRELTADELDAYGARIEGYTVTHTVLHTAPERQPTPNHGA